MVATAEPTATANLPYPKETRLLRVFFRRCCTSNRQCAPIFWRDKEPHAGRTGRHEFSIDHPWAGHDAALSELLRLATRTLRIFDDDLSKFRLESRENALNQEHFLTAEQGNQLCIVLKDAAALRRQSPRLMRLLENYSQQTNIIEYPPQLASVANSLCLADERHALVRIDQDRARAG